MTTLSFLYLASFLICFSGGVVVVSRGPKLTPNLAFGWLSVWLAYWAFIHLCISTSNDRDEAFRYIGWGVVWPLILSAGLVFILVLTERWQLLRRMWIWAAIHLPPLFFIVVQLINGNMAEPVENEWGWAPEITTPDLFSWTLDLWTIACCLLIVTLIVHFLATVDDRLKRAQMRTLLIGIAIAAFGAIAETLALATEVPVPGFSPLLSSVGYFFLGLAMWRHKMFALTPATVAEHLVDGMPDMFFLVHPGGTIALANRAACRGTGRDEDELEGKPASSLFQDAARLKRWLESIATSVSGAEDKLLDQDAVITAREGLTIPVSLAATIIRSEEGAPLGAMIIARDITERKVAAARQRRLERRIHDVEKAKALGRVAGGVAHDFNNLLGAIIGNVTLALDEKDMKPLVKDLLTDIEEASRRAAFLSKQMLTYAGKRRFTYTKIDISELVQELTEGIEKGLSHGIRLEIDLADDLPPVRGDRQELSQVLDALLQNAIEALEEEGGTVTVRAGTVAAQMSSDSLSGSPNSQVSVFVEVEDTGCGMAAITKARMFEPFFSTKFSGRGLGLAAALGVVHGHGGSFDVSSQEGLGTVIRLVLPFDRLDDSSSSEPSTRRSPLGT